MAELKNCTRCGELFAMSIRDICPTCYRKEEAAFQRVYHFLTKRKNREATLPEIVEATEVEEELIIKFIKENRLRASQFPKLSYPCERCTNPILEGRLCKKCANEIKAAIELQDELESSKLEQQGNNPIYYAVDHHKKRSE